VPIGVTARSRAIASRISLICLCRSTSPWYSIAIINTARMAATRGASTFFSHLAKASNWSTISGVLAASFPAAASMFSRRIDATSLQNAGTRKRRVTVDRLIPSRSAASLCSKPPASMAASSRSSAVRSSVTVSGVSSDIDRYQAFDLNHAREQLQGMHAAAPQLEFAELVDCPLASSGSIVARRSLSFSGSMSFKGPAAVK
jgi:hypothetical protein